MNTRKIFGYGTIAVMLALLVCTLSLTGCPDEPDDDPPLSGNITISPAGPVTTGTTLTANYTGTETVSYQWKNGSTDVGTGLTCTPTTAGSYTVTVSAAGYTGKTSDAVTVTGLQLPSEITVTNGSTLAEKLQWVQDNAHSNTSYTIEVSADEVISGYGLSYTDMSDITITLRGSGSAREISSSFSFTVGRGVTLILDNDITLKGSSMNYPPPLVVVNQGGALIMNDGAKIIDNRGGGVFLDDGAFTMNGGEISGNTARRGFSSGASFAYGGGVWVSGGTFTMNGGVISGNKTTSNTDNDYGGGVYVSNSNVGNRGTFTMSGGKITGNTDGGVYNHGTFTMIDGEITGNTDGGVYVDEFATFTMNGGEISGNTDYGVFLDDGTFTMEGGKISGNTGGVYVWGGTFRIVTGTVYGSDAAEGLRNRSALYVGDSATAQRGTFSGETWNSKGDLDTTDNTIKVVNGELVE